MGGRACHIIISSLEVPTSAPNTGAGRKRVETLMRIVYQNTTIARQLETDADYAQIVSTLADTGLTTEQLQFLIDKVSSIPTA